MELDCRFRAETIAGRQLANVTSLADADAVARYETTAARGSGRTLDRATAWGLLWELSTLDAAWLGASTRARVRRFMIPAADGRHTLYESTLPVAYDAVAMPAAVIAADLAGSVDTRERSAGLQSLEEMRQQWLADH